MPSSLSVRPFLEQAQHTPVIDVRSPGEFAHGHIPGAVNIPLFSNEERASVGTRYKQVGKESAFLLGLDIVGPKMSGFVKQAKKIVPDNNVLVHCWRGGMRSGSFAWLLQTAGFQVMTLQSGYKAYRTEVLHFFEQPLQVLILSGKTGSGKTDTLRALAEMGEQVIDLEALAHHKGSSFGALGQAPPPTTEHFENELHAAFTKLDTHRRIWLEDESVSIGSVHIPIALWQQMRQATTISLDVPKEIRIQRLVREYACFPPAQLESAIVRIRKRMGGQHVQAALQALNAGDYARVADLVLTYYDKTYVFGLSGRQPDTVRTISVPADDPTQNARRILAVADAISQPA